MKFIIKNIGLVESAEINVGGLTVLAGQNNIGKSYIEKAIYSVVKVINKASYEYGKVYLETCKKEIDTLKTDEDFQKKILQSPYQKEIKELLAKYENYILNAFLNPSIYSRNVLNNSNILFYSQLDRLIPSSSSTSTILQKLQRSKFIAQLPFYGYNDLLESIFKKEYNQKNNPTTNASLQIFSEENIIVNITVNDNETTAFEVHYAPKFIDATLIETPTILSLVAYIRDNLAFAKKSSKLLPDYVTDLVQKLVEGGYEKPTNNPIFNSIRQTIQGKLEFDRDNIVYKDEKENAFEINNVASGIKSFGLIQLLLAGESINPQSILIIDEPEVHLHPEWQLEYAKLLVELVKHDIPVVVASHSPYFVEALKVYSDKAKISDKTYFYLGEMGETGSIFKDVTQNLDLLFEKFSAPMIKLIIEK